MMNQLHVEQQCDQGEDASYAAVLRAKECVLKTATTIQENAEDIYAEAQQINEERAAKDAEEYTDVEDVEEAEETAEEASEENEAK